MSGQPSRKTIARVNKSEPYLDHEPVHLVHSEGLVISGIQSDWFPDVGFWIVYLVADDPVAHG